MAFGRIIKNFFGQGESLMPSPEPFAVEAAPAAATIPAPQSAAPPAAVMHREEILDGRSRIAGYRFTARDLRRGERPPAATVLDLLRAEAIANFAQRRLAVIPLGSEDWRGHDYRPFVAPNTAFLIDAPTPGADADAVEAWLAILREIRECGAKVALAGGGAAIPGALDLADLLFVKLADYSLEAFEQALSGFQRSHPALQLIVENVQTWPEHRLCLARGAACSLGPFAALADEADDKARLNQSRLVLIEMLNLLRNDADADELAAVAKRDPVVAVSVVSMANSPAAGLSSAVASVDQAIVVLGRAHLYRWLTISLFRVGGSPRDEALLELALRRGRFLEILARERALGKEADELFLVGLLSLADILLCMPMAKVVERMNLPEGVTEVLVSNDGPHGRYLLLAIAMEKGRFEQIERLAGLLGADVAAVEAASAAARQWTDEALAGI